MSKSSTSWIRSQPISSASSQEDGRKSTMHLFAPSKGSSVLALSKQLESNGQRSSMVTRNMLKTDSSDTNQGLEISGRSRTSAIVSKYTETLADSRGGQNSRKGSNDLGRKTEEGVAAATHADNKNKYHATMASYAVKGNALARAGGFKRQSIGNINGSTSSSADREDYEMYDMNDPTSKYSSSHPLHSSTSSHDSRSSDQSKTSVASAFKFIPHRISDDVIITSKMKDVYLSSSSSAAAAAATTTAAPSSSSSVFSSSTAQISKPINNTITQPILPKQSMATKSSTVNTNIASASSANSTESQNNAKTSITVSPTNTSQTIKATPPPVSAPSQTSNTTSTSKTMLPPKSTPIVPTETNNVSASSGGIAHPQDTNNNNNNDDTIMTTTDEQILMPSSAGIRGMGNISGGFGEDVMMKPDPSTANLSNAEKNKLFFQRLKEKEVKSRKPSPEKLPSKPVALSASSSSSHLNTEYDEDGNEISPPPEDLSNNPEAMKNHEKARNQHYAKLGATFTTGKKLFSSSRKP